MILDFNKFDRVCRVLEGQSPDDARGLSESELAELSRLNEGLLKDIFGGWFDKIKKTILKKIPGGVLKRVDQVILEYEKGRTELMQKEVKEKEKAFKAEIDMEKDAQNAKKYEQIIERAKTAIKAIKKAADAKIDKIEAQLEDLAKDKSELVGDYINLKISEVQEKLAMAELKALEKFASEDRKKEMEAAAEELKKSREARQKEFESAVSKEPEPAGAKAKQGERWTRKDKKGEEHEVTVVSDPAKSKDGKITVRGKKKNEFQVQVGSLIKRVDK